MHSGVQAGRVDLSDLHDNVDVHGGYEVEFHYHTEQAHSLHHLVSFARVYLLLLADGLRNEYELVLALELEVGFDKVVAACLELTRLPSRRLFTHNQRQA